MVELGIDRAHFDCKLALMLNSLKHLDGSGTLL
jgi:hypothetical protein